MNRIVITGSFATGKTTVSLILSHLTGFMHLLPKSDFETAKALHYFNEDQDQFYLNFMNCISKLSDRLQNESLAESGFISDGCILNEVAYLKAIHQISNQGMTGTKKFKEQSLMINSIENAVSYYFRNRYDKIILLSKYNDTISGFSETTHQFRSLYKTYLMEMLEQSAQSFFLHQFNDLEPTINKIVEENGFECRMSVKEAIYKTQLNLYQIHTHFAPAGLN